MNFKLYRCASVGVPANRGGFGGGRARLWRSPVDELIDDDDVSRLDLVPERSAGCGDQQMGATFFSQRPDVGPVVHVGRHDGVLSPMSEEKVQSDKNTT